MWQQIEENMQMLEKAVIEMKSRSRKLAEAEHNYRVALSERLTELRAEGQPVTHLSDIARGEKKIAKPVGKPSYFVFSIKEMQR